MIIPLESNIFILFYQLNPYDNLQFKHLIFFNLQLGSVSYISSCFIQVR